MAFGEVSRVSVCISPTYASRSDEQFGQDFVGRHTVCGRLAGRAHHWGSGRLDAVPLPRRDECERLVHVLRGQRLGCGTAQRYFGGLSNREGEREEQSWRAAINEVAYVDKLSLLTGGTAVPFFSPPGNGDGTVVARSRCRTLWSTDSFFFCAVS